MNKIAIIQVSEAGKEIARQLQKNYQAEIVERSAVGELWNDYDAFVFIGALGICVRSIAPFIKDKHSDPAVVCIDSLGKNVISVLSGHIGGANELTREIAAAIDGHEVITTQSDNAGLWALDTLGQRYGWTMADGDAMNECIFAFVNRQPTALLLEAGDEGTAYLEQTMPEHVTLIHYIQEASPSRFKLLIIVSPFVHSLSDGLLTLHFVPKVTTVGFGLAHQAEPVANIYEEITTALQVHHVHLASIRRWCSIDVKADEPFCAMLKDEYHENILFYTADELGNIEVPNPSDTVQKHVGTPSVCEAAAILGSNHGQLIVNKVKGKNWTMAVASSNATTPCLRAGGESAFIEIVGAGPGDPDLVSVRGRKMLEKADLILYAGSLVPKALTECHKPGAVVRSSADMTLEEQCALMKEHYEKGHFIVRLHTGDPCIFGAIQEQMAFFDQNGMKYHITPGISSFLAAAAELRSQFTIPERTQTIILTRGEGRTPMPEREKLHLLARSQSTMCIFLSAAIVDDVQRELLQEYPEDTPVAACYHLTWPDQHIYRGVLKDLAKIVHDNHLTLTTMLVVGEAIDNRQGLSELYNKHFTHLFRKGD